MYFRNWLFSQGFWIKHYQKHFIGLSFFERPILDHDAKAHNFEIRRISCGFHVKSGGFHMKNLINQMFQQKLFSLGGCRGRGYDLGFYEILGHSPHPAFIKLKSFCWNTCFYKVLGGFHMKSAGLHEIQWISCEIERPLARNCNPMFIIFSYYMEVLQWKNVDNCWIWRPDWDILDLKMEFYFSLLWLIFDLIIWIWYTIQLI